MTTPKDGGPAFPAHDYIVGNIQADGFQKLGETRGMTLRDYFAAKAMQGFLSRKVIEFGYEPERQEHRVNLAANAYAIADAMLAAREKKG